MVRSTLAHSLGNKHVSEDINGKGPLWPSHHTWIGTLWTARLRSASRFSTKTAAAAAQRTLSAWRPHSGSAKSRACSVHARQGCSSPCWKTGCGSRVTLGRALPSPWAPYLTQLTFKWSLSCDRETADRKFPVAHGIYTLVLPQLHQCIGYSLASVWRTSSSGRLELPWISAAQASWKVPHACSWVLNGLFNPRPFMLLALYHTAGTVSKRRLRAIASHSFVGDGAQEVPMR